MPVELAELVSSWRTAVVTSEVQNGVIGDEAALPVLAEAARQTMVPNLARLVKAARAAGVEVVHATFAAPARRQGRRTTTPACSPASTSRRSSCCPAATPSRSIPEIGVVAHRHRPDPHARAQPDVGHRPRRRAAQPRRDHHRRHRRVGERRRHQPGHGGGQPGLRRGAAPRRGVRGARRLRRRRHREHPAPAGHRHHGRRAGRRVGGRRGEVLPVADVRRRPTSGSTLAPVAEAAEFSPEGVPRPDYVFYPDKLYSKYPYTASGRAQVPPPETSWPHAWGHDRGAGGGHRAHPLLHPRVRAAGSDPFVVAKVARTAAWAVWLPGAARGGGRAGMRGAIHPARRQLFERRGARMEEQIEVLRTLWGGGMVEHHGEFDDFDRLEMSPAPTSTVSHLVGGHSDMAVRCCSASAATAGGWACTTTPPR